jgi:hypothetical protein
MLSCFVDATREGTDWQCGRLGEGVDQALDFA